MFIPLNMVLIGIDPYPYGSIFYPHKSSQDIIGIATTGSGKTVAFLFPAFRSHRSPTTSSKRKA